MIGYPKKALAKKGTYDHVEKREREREREFEFVKPAGMWSW